MPRKLHTLTVLACALSWLLVGLHLPVLHDLSHAGTAPRWELLALTAGFLVLAIVDTWALLRMPASRAADGLRRLVE